MDERDRLVRRKRPFFHVARTQVTAKSFFHVCGVPFFHQGASDVGATERSAREFGHPREVDACLALLRQQIVDIVDDSAVALRAMLPAFF